MNKNVSMYLDKVCSQIKSKQTRLSTRSEIAGHIRLSIDELKESGMDEAEATETALSLMGNPQDIGKRIAEFNLPWQNILTTIIGGLILAVLLIWVIIHRQIYFLDISALGFVVMLTLAFVLVGGLSQLTRLSALARARSAALYAGGIGVILGLLEALGNIGDLYSLGVGLSFCITSALYGIIVSAVMTSIGHLLRPLEANDIRKILGFEDI